MDERVARLKSPEDCEQFAKNVEERGKPKLAFQARRRALELRAEQRGAKTKVEQEAPTGNICLRGGSNPKEWTANKCL